MLKNNNTFTYAKKEETPKPVIEEENLYDTSKISVAVPKKTEYYLYKFKDIDKLNQLADIKIKYR